MGFREWKNCVCYLRKGEQNGVVELACADRSIDLLLPGAHPIAGSKQINKMDG
jgi:hypothetical protein